MTDAGKILCTVLIISLGIGRIEAAEPVSEETLGLLKTFVQEFIEVTPGEGKYPATFQMGGDPKFPSEQKLREVAMREPFAMAKYEVPQNLYEAVTGANPSRWKGPRNSAEMMTQQEAVDFCRKLTQLLRQQKQLPENQEIRLPTEAEWEYCCRAGTETAYSFGPKAQADEDKSPKASLLDPFAWHTGNAAGNDPPVGALKPNPWGFYDMHGYLWEYCSEKGAAEDTRYDDATKSQSKITFVIRGGSWQDPYPLLRSSSRLAFGAEARSPAVGFRCVRSTVKQQD
ncbi:MAG TPA: formylglycine-generating enzyme family protein [Planctomycetaceae bacterium]|nr:formylglycine-generating enzyme family protein [Planctomycetaceae bacterium]